MSKLDHTADMEWIKRKRAVLQEILDNTETPEMATAWEDNIAQEVVNGLPSLRRFLKYDVAHGAGGDLTMVCQALREIADGVTVRLNDERYNGRERIAALAMYKLCNFAT